MNVELLEGMGFCVNRSTYSRDVSEGISLGGAYRFKENVYDLYLFFDSTDVPDVFGDMWVEVSRRLRVDGGLSDQVDEVCNEVSHEHGFSEGVESISISLTPSPSSLSVSGSDFEEVYSEMQEAAKVVGVEI